MKEKLLKTYKELKQKNPNLQITRDYFVTNTGFSKHIIRKIFGGFTNFLIEAEKFNNTEFKSDKQFVNEQKELEFSDKYIYNKDSKKYIFLLESKIGKNLVLSDNKVKNIIKSYSNFKGDQSSINEIAIKFDIPRKFVIEILKCLEVTHDSLPVTNEDLTDKESDKLVEEILQEKRFALYQKLEKQDWVETKEQAEKWRNFESGVLNPLKNYLDDLKFDPIPEIKPKANFDSEETIVIGATDWQIGSKADGKFLFFGEEWDTNKAIDSVFDFTERIIEKSIKRNISKAVIIFGGDIFHGLEGETAKKTLLKCDTFRQDQFDAAIKAISCLVDCCSQYFKKLECKCYTGNHEGWTSYPVFKLIESIFSNRSNVNFDISLKEFNHFSVENSLIIYHHGASADYKYKIPNDAKGRKELVHRLIRIAEREGNYRGINRIFFIKGDTHSFECLDYGQFTFYTFGSLPSGDEYADALALESTPTQNALVLGDSKDYETIHLTF